MPGAVLAIWCDAHAHPQDASSASSSSPSSPPCRALALVFLFLKAPATPAALLHASALGVLPALFVGSALGLFLFGKVGDHGLSPGDLRVLFFSGIGLVAFKALRLARPRRACRPLICLPAAPGRAQALDKPDPVGPARGYRVAAAFSSVPSHTDSKRPPWRRRRRCAALLGEVLEPDSRFSVQLRTPRQEIISTILADIEALRPEVDRQDFKGMVLGILRFHWPCRDDIPAPRNQLLG